MRYDVACEMARGDSARFSKHFYVNASMFLGTDSREPCLDPSGYSTSTKPTALSVILYKDGESHRIFGEVDRKIRGY